MKNNLLKPFIKLIKKGDMSVFSYVFDEFKKLILIYSGKLKYEDATSELTLFLIELLYSIDLERFDNNESDDLSRYIAVSLKNKYIALSIQKSRVENYEKELLEEYLGYVEEFDKNLCFIRGADKLNDAQRFVVLYHYVYGYSIAEIGAILRVSRQAVNKTKNRALAVLRKEMMR